MSKYKIKDLVTKTKDELIERITFLRKEQFNLRFQVANGSNENPLRFRLIRREIAAIKTILNNKMMKVK
jgi:ribosomal protein L29